MGQVEVSRAQLLSAVKSLRKLEAGTKADVVFRQLDGELRLHLGGTSSAVFFKGEWPHAVRIPVKALEPLERMLRERGGADVTTIRYADGRLKIGSTSYTAAVDDTPFTVPILSLAKDAPLLEVLKFARAHAEDELKAAGLQKLIQDAELQRDKLIAKAVAILKPLQLTREDLLEAFELRHFPPAR